MPRFSHLQSSVFTTQEPTEDDQVHGPCDGFHHLYNYEHRERTSRREMIPVGESGCPHSAKHRIN